MRNATMHRHVNGLPCGRPLALGIRSCSATCLGQTLQYHSYTLQHYAAFANHRQEAFRSTQALEWQQDLCLPILAHKYNSQSNRKRYRARDSGAPPALPNSTPAIFTRRKTRPYPRMLRTAIPRWLCSKRALTSDGIYLRIQNEKQRDLDRLGCTPFYRIHAFLTRPTK